MRILHVATLFTPDGEFGGPTRVAMNQTASLAARGHSVTLAGAARGHRTLPTSIDGVECWFHPANEIPGLGMAGMTARGLTRRLSHVIREFDIVHLHMARDLVTLPASRQARRHRVPYVVQSHGMIDPSDRLLARPLDRVLTVPALREARRVLSLTGTEDAHLRSVGGDDLPIERLTNGVPDPTASAERSSPPEVLFLARLDDRKRPDLFARVAASLLESGVDATFTIAGPDSGRAGAVDAVIASSGRSDRLRREGAVDAADVSARMGRASIYVLPSVHEPYPMSVLEAMAAGRPVVVTHTCGLADTVARHRCGRVVDHTDSALSDAIADLLAHPQDAAAAGERGRAAVREEFGMGAVADRLEAVYDAAAVATTHPRPGGAAWP